MLEIVDATAKNIESQKPIYPIMSAPEIALYKAAVGSAGTYVEFGTGGSTIVAAELGNERIYSVESPKGWADYVFLTSVCQCYPLSSISISTL